MKSAARATSAGGRITDAASAEEVNKIDTTDRVIASSSRTRNSPNALPVQDISAAVT
ncbi:hypothetical protein [Nocardia sp. CA-119907]|uniref:hypothetical protein n=1 Tax=Nocardia sp. CA-119907 TaxID=3239973 RepID=UPI003D979EDE